MVEDVAAYTAELTRHAVLVEFINDVVADSAAALRSHDPGDALRILKAAGPKYDRLGGEPPEDPVVFMSRSIQEVARMVVTREHGA